MRWKLFVGHSAAALPLTLALALLAAGCGSKHSAPAANPTTAEAQATEAGTNETPPSPTTPPVEAPPVPGTATDDAAQASGPPNLEAITLQLHHWIGAKQRLPRNFEEFAASESSKIPPPPAGKKYAINSQWRVVLVDR